MTASSAAPLTPASLRGAIGNFPYRLQMAGGWIDQPFVSEANPEPPGSMVVVSLHPTVKYMDRSGMATGTRVVARELWGDSLPTDRSQSSTRSLISSLLALSSGAYMAQALVGSALNLPGISARMR